MTQRTSVLIAALIAVGTAIVRTHGPAPDLVVVGYEVVGSVPVSRSREDVMLRVQVAHRGHAFGLGASRVKVHLVAQHPNLQITDAEASFGNIAPGTTATSIDTLTVRKPRGVPLNKGHVAWRVTASRDLIVPDEWKGTWDLAITYRDAHTGVVTATDRTRNDIRPDEAFGLHMAADQGLCTGRTIGGGIELLCGFKVHEARCFIVGLGTVSAEVDGDTLTGSARWSSVATAGCGGDSPHDGQTIEIAGTRVSPDYAATPPAGTSLLAKFITHPAVAALSGQ